MPQKKLQTISLPTLGFTYQTRFLSFNGVLSKRQFILVSLSYKSHLCMWSLVNCTSVLGEQCFSPYTPLQLTVIVQCSPDDRLTNIIQAVSLGFLGVRTPFSLSATPGEGTLVGGFASFFRVVSVNNCYSEILRNSFLPLYVRRQRVIIHFPKCELWRIDFDSSINKNREHTHSQVLAD